PLEKWSFVSSYPGPGSSSEPGRRPGPAAGPSASMAILDDQNMAASSGSASNALHLLGSFLPLGVLSNASKAALFSGARFWASSNRMPLHCPAEAGGGLNAIVLLVVGSRFWSFYLIFVGFPPLEGFQTSH